MPKPGEISDNYINEANQPDEENVSLSPPPPLQPKGHHIDISRGEIEYILYGISKNRNAVHVPSNYSIICSSQESPKNTSLRSKKQMGDMIDGIMTTKYAVAQLPKQPASGNALAAAKPLTRKRTHNQSSNQKKCTYCRALDHLGYDCPEVKGGQSRQFYLFNNGRCRLCGREECFRKGVPCRYHPIKCTHCPPDEKDPWHMPSACHNYYPEVQESELMPPANAPPTFMAALAALPTHNADPSFQVGQRPMPSNVIPQHMPHDRGNHPWKRRRHQNQRQMVIYNRSQHYHSHYSSVPSRPNPHNSPPPSYRPSQSERDGAKLYDQRERGREHRAREVERYESDHRGYRHQEGQYNSDSERSRRSDSDDGRRSNNSGSESKRSFYAGSWYARAHD